MTMLAVSRSGRVFGGLLLALSLLLAVIGCSPQDVVSEEDVIAVRKVMEDRAKAIAAKDIELYKSLILDGYSEQSVTKAQIVGDMALKFQNYPGLKLTYQRSPVEVKMNTARVVGRVTYDVVGLEKPVQEQEILVLRRIDGKWFISGGININLF